MSFVYGTLNFRSINKKRNTKSSAEAKLIGTSEYVPFNFCIIMFMEAQGFMIKKNVLL